MPPAIDPAPIDPATTPDALAGAGASAGSPGIDALFAEAERQLSICNACRYCEGYCAVFPALERRMALSPGDLSHLANLCHDCRACLYACMYAPPHEFAVNPPKILSELRSRTWDAHTPVPSFLRRPAAPPSDDSMRAERALTTPHAHQAETEPAAPPPPDDSMRAEQALTTPHAHQAETEPAPAGQSHRPVLRHRAGIGTRPMAGALVAFVVAAGLIVVLAAATEGLGHLWRSRTAAASPYDVVSYPAILVVMSVPFVCSVLVLAWAGARYWRHTRGRLADLWDLAAWRSALAEAGQLRYLKGGGAGCPYPGDHPGAARRRLHAAVAYGFVACLVATVSAGITQDLAGVSPPYPLLSVPVVAGTLGGIGLVGGSVGLLVLRGRSDPQATDPAMSRRDEGLLAGLALLGATGLAALVTRGTATYGPLLVLHLAAVDVAFAVAPLSKLNHALYRLLALVQDNLERR